MRVRHRITLWVSLSGLLSSIILSLIVFFWGLESPYEFLDQELEIRAHSVRDELIRERAAAMNLHNETLDHFTHLYWTRIYDGQGKLIYASKLAQKVEMPLKDRTQGYVVATEIPLNVFYPEEEDEPAVFWNRVFLFKAQGQNYTIHVARPVESLVGEAIHSAIMIGSSLVIATLILILVSYYVAGKILTPIQEINKLAVDITENTLEKRIPLSGNRDELDELAQALNAMFNRLQFSFRRQKQFVANASHELKTPLTLLRLSTEEILQYPQLPVAVEEKLVAQEQALARINQLVKGLLDLSRLELSDSLQRSRFFFNELWQSILDDFQLLLRQRKLQIDCQMPRALELYADQEKIRRLCINLVDNAVRYNNPQGKITVQAEVSGQELVCTVANTGVGIDKQDRSAVFEQFFRCEQSRAIGQGGSGLGLTIVQRIVTLHGGTIAVVDSPPGWTVIMIRFPKTILA